MDNEYFFNMIQELKQEENSDSNIELSSEKIENFSTYVIEAECKKSIDSDESNNDEFMFKNREDSFKRHNPRENIHNSAHHSRMNIERLNSPQDSRPKRLCYVCNDFASGLHYGIPSCEACKAFFKRTVQGNVEYTCASNEDCEITKRRRKACQACRYQKCLNVGMLKEGVRMDRVRGGRQKYKRAKVSPPRNHHPHYEQKVMSDMLVSIEPDKVFAHPDSSNLSDTDSLHDVEVPFVPALANLIDRELIATIGWAKLMPGFSQLLLSDQMRLLQASWLDLFLLNVAHRSSPFNGTIVFSDDLSLTKMDAETSGISDGLYEQLVLLCKRISSLHLSKLEHIFLKSIQLFNPDAPTLEDAEEVQRMRDVMQNNVCSLELESLGLRATSRLCSLIFRLSTVQQCKSEASKFLIQMRREGCVTLQRLVREMIDHLEQT